MVNRNGFSNTRALAAEPEDRARRLLKTLDELTVRQVVPRIKYDSQHHPTIIVLPGDLATDENVQILDRFPTLAHLQIICARSAISPAALAHLAKLPALRDREILSSYPAFTEDVARIIGSIHTLRILVICYAAVEPNALPLLAKLVV
jgi:hypothetical protein